MIWIRERSSYQVGWHVTSFIQTRYLRYFGMLSCLIVFVTGPQGECDEKDDIILTVGGLNELAFRLDTAMNRYIFIFRKRAPISDIPLFRARYPPILHQVCIVRSTCKIPVVAFEIIYSCRTQRVWRMNSSLVQIFFDINHPEGSSMLTSRPAFSSEIMSLLHRLLPFQRR